MVGSESLNDVTIQLYHARQLFGGRMNSTRMNKIEMFSVNFNTCFVPPGTKSIRFNRLVSLVVKKYLDISNCCSKNVIDNHWYKFKKKRKITLMAIKRLKLPHD